MANYFYTDENGQKYSLTEQRLQTLVDRGVITPTTPLTTDTGHQGLAGQIPGLKFNNVAPPKAEQTTYYSPPRRSAAYEQTNEATGATWWLFDFAFRDLRLPVINLWACRIIYVICFIGAILWGIGVSIFLFGNAIVESGAAVLVLIPLVWLGVALFIFAARLFCEWYIIVFDWIVETTKAARKYNDE